MQICPFSPVRPRHPARGWRTCRLCLSLGSRRCWRVCFQPDRKNSMRIPTATYRVQFNRAFKFSDAKAIVDYLDDLGISDCYASPVLKTPAASDNGYDVCDHSQLNPAL